MIYTRPWFTDFMNYTRHASISLGRDALALVPKEHRPLLRRATGATRLNMTVDEFLDA
jgi:hypothetical protein